jgi:hypothetical protein
MFHEKINGINLMLVDFYINITWLEFITKRNPKEKSITRVLQKGT